MTWNSRRAADGPGESHRNLMLRNGLGLVSQEGRLSESSALQRAEDLSRASVDTVRRSGSQQDIACVGRVNCLLPPSREVGLAFAMFHRFRAERLQLRA
jgi:hypothetical protein